MKCLEIIEEYLRQNGYDGLMGEYCGCLIDNLAPCSGDNSIQECEPGYLAPCPPECGDHDWHIVPNKPESSMKKGTKGIIGVLDWECCDSCQLHNPSGGCMKIEGDGFDHWDVEIDFGEKPAVVNCIHYHKKPEAKP